MAEKSCLEDRLEVLTLTRKEAADLAALLIGQLADVPIQGNPAGAAPTVDIVEEGRIVCRLGFLVRPG